MVRLVIFGLMLFAYCVGYATGGEREHQRNARQWGDYTAAQVNRALKTDKATP